MTRASVAIESCDSSPRKHSEPQGFERWPVSVAFSSLRARPKDERRNLQTRESLILGAVVARVTNCKALGALERAAQWNFPCATSACSPHMPSGVTP